MQKLLEEVSVVGQLVAGGLPRRRLLAIPIPSVHCTEHKDCISLLFREKILFWLGLREIEDESYLGVSGAAGCCPLRFSAGGCPWLLEGSLAESLDDILGLIEAVLAMLLRTRETGAGTDFPVQATGGWFVA